MRQTLTTESEACFSHIDKCWKDRKQCVLEDGNSWEMERASA